MDLKPAIFEIRIEAENSILKSRDSAFDHLEVLSLSKALACKVLRL